MPATTSKTGPTPSFYMPEACLVQQTGVAVYSYDPASKALTPIPWYMPSSGAFQWYCASVLPQVGSWFFPVAAVNLTPYSWNNTRLGGITEFKSSGNGIWSSEGPYRLVRPAQLFWWIPQATLTTAFPVQPGENNGYPLGHFPLDSPQGNPAAATVTQTGDKITITIPPKHQTTVVDIATSLS